MGPLSIFMTENLRLPIRLVCWNFAKLVQFEIDLLIYMLTIGQDEAIIGFTIAKVEAFKYFGELHYWHSIHW